MNIFEIVVVLFICTSNVRGAREGFFMRERPIYRLIRNEQRLNQRHEDNERVSGLPETREEFNRTESTCGQAEIERENVPPLKPENEEREPKILPNRQNQDNVRRVVPNVVNFLNKRLTTVIGEKGNFFFSPFCISVALAMTYLGAGGTTALEMEQALGYQPFLRRGSSQNIHDSFRYALKALENSSGEYKLLVANGLFMQSGMEVLPQFTKELMKQYNAIVMFSDFAKDKQKTIEEINSWVSNHTQGKIPTLMDEPLDESTVLALMNAIYFNGSWKYPFLSKHTAEDTFYKVDGTTKQIPFMVLTKRVWYYMDEDLGYSFLELPYKGNHIAMLLFLPNDRDQFPEIELTSELLTYVLQHLRRSTVMAKIPKFKMAYSRELSRDMEELGVVELFSEQRANLTGIRKQNDLFLSLVVHKAVIDVNEQGSEAAAVSGMTFTSRSGHAAYKSFTADHPFLFCIFDRRTGTILFMGRLSDP